MPSPPGHSPFNSSEARAVQAYAYELNRGGTQAQAEARAQAACPGCDIPAVASAAFASVSAAKLIGRHSAGEAPEAGVQQGSLFGQSLQGASLPGATKATVTLAYYFKPGGVMGDVLERPLKSSVIQVDIPLGAQLQDILDMLDEAAAEAASGDEFGYSGEFEGWSVLTVIGH